MASRIFTEASVIGIGLEEVRQAIITEADKVNESRRIPAEGERTFATIYIGSLLKEPKPLDGTSFLVQYSDDDSVAEQIIDTALERIKRAVQEDEVFYLRRDPYCA